MCGIIGYAGRRDALPVLVQGLRLLSYRGYDSAGVAILDGGTLRVAKGEGRVGDLAPTWQSAGLTGSVGVGHTRWATHGRPSDTNAHPHEDVARRVAVVHNGVLENDLALRQELESRGVVFRSDTDTEVFAHLFAQAFEGEPVAAAQEVLRRCRGAFALAFVHAALPGRIVAVRVRSPLLLGLGLGENLVASDLRALAGNADRMIELGEREIAVVDAEGVRVFDEAGRAVHREARPVPVAVEDLGRGDHPHYMHKEIHEQPDRLYELLGGRVDVAGRRVRLDELPFTPADWRAFDRVDLIACGTAHYASLYGAYALEALAGIPARALLASEYEARSPVLSERVLVIAVSQSGETRDTAHALEVAAAGGARTLGVLNVRESVIGRAVEGLVDIHAGLEVGVASTKAYTCMLGALLLVALEGAARRDRADERWSALAGALLEVPEALRRVLGRVEPVAEAAADLANAQNLLFLGRGPDAATALEGALKMKEISYIHAEGYPAGEMKHGPIALVTPLMPTVAVATPGPWRGLMLGNVREILAREGPVLLVAGEGDTEVERLDVRPLTVPVLDPWLQPILNVVPLQLLAYECARRRGCDIDQPRNLAKTVTVQ